MFCVVFSGNIGSMFAHFSRYFANICVCFSCFYSFKAPQTFFFRSVLSQALFSSSALPFHLAPPPILTPPPLLAAVPQSHDWEWVRAPRGGTKTTPAEDKPPTCRGRMVHSHVRVVVVYLMFFFFWFYKLVCSHRFQLLTWRCNNVGPFRSGVDWAAGFPVFNAT